MRERFFTPRLRVTNYEELNALLPDPEAIKWAGDLPIQVAYEYGGTETTANHFPRQYFERLCTPTKNG